MKIESGTSIVCGTPDSGNSHLKIRNAWSDEEAEKRCRIAMEMQIRLIAIISMGPQSTCCGSEVFDKAS